MLCVPAVKTGMVMLALPEALSVNVPSVVLPSTTVTEPVGWMPTEDETLIFSVTESPYTEGLSELVTAVVTTLLELALVTTWTMGPEVRALKSSSPLYCLSLIHI